MATKLEIQSDNGIKKLQLLLAQMGIFIMDYTKYEDIKYALKILDDSEFQSTFLRHIYLC